MDSEVSPDDTLGMIIQLPLTGFWGTDAESDIRSALAEALDQLSIQHQLGEFDGTDCGRGTMNFFAYGIVPIDWDRALKVVVKKLQQRNLVEQAIIVKSFPGDLDDDDKFIVEWPKEYQGQFELF